jgi:hypothetical protein
MMVKKLLLLALLPLAGCAYSIEDIDISKTEPACARQCTATYSSCIHGGPVVGAKTEILRACREAYSICTRTCPAK